MRILVIGAGGGTGEQVVEQAQAAGHEVTALVHHSENAANVPAVRWVQGDVLNPATLEKLMPGQEAVIDTLGGHTPWRDETTEADAAKLILQSMKANGVKRLVVVSAIGVGDTRDLVPGWYAKLIMPTLLRGAMHDKEQMEQEVEHSDVEWTLVRPAHLIKGERTGNVRLFEHGTGEVAHKITRADVAGFLLEVLARGQYIRQAVNIASS